MLILFNKKDNDMKGVVLGLWVMLMTVCGYAAELSPEMFGDFSLLDRRITKNTSDGPVQEICPDTIHFSLMSYDGMPTYVGKRPTEGQWEVVIYIREGEEESSDGAGGDEFVFSSYRGHFSSYCAEYRESHRIYFVPVAWDRGKVCLDPVSGELTYEISETWYLNAVCRYRKM